MSRVRWTHLFETDFFPMKSHILASRGVGYIKGYRVALSRPSFRIDMSCSTKPICPHVLHYNPAWSQADRQLRFLSGEGTLQYSAKKVWG